MNDTNTSGPFGKPEVKWTDGAWERRDYPTIMSGLVVRYRPINRIGDTEISASREMVCINVCFDEHGHKYVLEIIERAVKLHKALAAGLRDLLPVVDPRMDTTDTPELPSSYWEKFKL